jgi:hypothetical protein
MIAVNFLHFLLNLLIAGALIRYIELTFRGSWISQALGVIY